MSLPPSPTVIRLPVSLLEQATHRAEKEGVSLEELIIRAVGKGVDKNPPLNGNAGEDGSHESAAL